MSISSLAVSADEMEMKNEVYLSKARLLYYFKRSISPRPFFSSVTRHLVVLMGNKLIRAAFEIRVKGRQPSPLSVGSTTDPTKFSKASVSKVKLSADQLKIEQNESSRTAYKTFLYSFKQVITRQA